MKRTALTIVALVAILIGTVSAAPMGIITCPTFDDQIVEHLKLNGILGPNAAVSSISFSAAEFDACHRLTVTFNVTADVKKAIHDATAP